MCATCTRDIDYYESSDFSARQYAKDYLATRKGSAASATEQAPEPIAVKTAAADGEPRIPGLLGAWVLLLAMLFAAVLSVIFS